MKVTSSLGTNARVLRTVASTKVKQEVNEASKMPLVEKLTVDDMCKKTGDTTRTYKLVVKMADNDGEDMITAFSYLMRLAQRDDGQYAAYVQALAAALGVTYYRDEA
jgi:DUF971 family protein